MKELSLSTKLYLLAIYLIGFGLFLWNVLHITGINYLMVIVLSLLASFFLIFKVEGATNRSHYTFSFLIYGFAFAYFSLGETLLVILISNLIEWAWNRPLWFIQVFNICCYVIVMTAAYFVFTHNQPVRIPFHSDRHPVRGDQYEYLHFAQSSHHWHHRLVGTWREF